ncbi:DDE_4 domain-containing protein, partial [Cephalotus follicularis]
LIEILEGNERICMKMFRMEKSLLLSLCKDLEIKYGLKGSINLCLKEIIGMWMHILGHGCANRLARERFQHSCEIISRNFKIVLVKICLMAIAIIKQLNPDFKEIPEKINCICVDDGVYVSTSLSQEQQVPYIRRKGTLTQNIMMVCDFDMQFTFAYASWRGTPHDTNVL